MSDVQPFRPIPIDIEKARLQQVKAEARYAGVAYPCVLLGDSRAAEWPDDLLGRLRRPVANLGLSGAAIQHVLWQLGQSQIDFSRVNTAIVVLGINHLMTGHEAKDIAQGIQHVVRSVLKKAPDADVVVMDVFPRTPAYEYTEAAREELNKRLANRGAGSGLFRTAATSLSDAADERLFSDGLHLTRAGYEILTQDLLNALPEPSAAPAYLRQDIGDVTVIADLGEGASVVDALSAVLAELDDLGGRRLVVREADGRWTGIVEAAGSVSLVALGYMPLVDALAVARMRVPVAARG